MRSEEEWWSFLDRQREAWTEYVRGNGKAPTLCTCKPWREYIEQDTTAASEILADLIDIPGLSHCPWCGHMLKFLELPDFPRPDPPPHFWRG